VVPKPLDYENVDVMAALKDMTGGRRPDAYIDAVGMEAHGTGIMGTIDSVKHKLGMQTDRPTVLRQAVQACCKGGTVSVPGVYGGIADTIPLGAAFSKGITFKMGQTHVHRYLQPLMNHIIQGDIDPSVIITHRMSLDDAAEGYKIFNEKTEDCMKVVLSTT
jgi:threonine dehydrogenase-like Zn-dependent dehydrogenase